MQYSISMKFHENSRITRSASENLARREFHFAGGSIFLDDICEKPSRLSNCMRLYGHRLISYLTFTSVPTSPARFLSARSGTENFRRAHGQSPRIGGTGVIDAIADTAYGAILGWRAGEQHWNGVLSGFAQGSACDLGQVRTNEPDPPRPRPQGGVTPLDPWPG